MLELFVSGKNSEYISAGLAATMQSLGYTVCVYKPVEFNPIQQNGYLKSPDLSLIKKMDPNIKTYFSYLIETEKNIENIDIEELIKDFDSIREEFECVIICGSQDTETKITGNIKEKDLIKTFNIPVLLVLDETFQDVCVKKLQKILKENIKLRGVLIPIVPNNDYIKPYAGTNILGLIPNFDKNIDPNDLISEVLTKMDIEKIFDVKIAKLEL